MHEYKSGTLSLNSLQWFNHKIGEDGLTRAVFFLAAIGTVWVSKVGVDLKDTFWDLSDHFLFEVFAARCFSAPSMPIEDLHPVVNVKCWNTRFSW